MIFNQVAAAGEVDVSFVTYFAPVLALLIVFVVMFALLRKTEILGDHVGLDLFISFLIATIFVAVGSTRQYVLTVIPWFAVLLISLFFILILVGFIGKDAESLAGKGLGFVFIVLLAITFLVSGIKVFSSTLSPYLPGAGFGSGGDPQLLYFSDWIFSPPVLGAILLLVVAAITSWVLIKFGGSEK